MAKYKRSPGARFSNKQAALLGTLLERFDGALKPKQLVDAARPKTSPVHSLFEWNDGRAAEQFRLVQARDHINHLRIVVQIDGADRPTKAYHSVVIEGDDDRTYASVAIVRRSVELRQQVVQQALNEAERWAERYREYRELYEIIRAVKKTTRKHKRKHDLASVA